MGPLHAVQSFGENSRGGGFSNSASAGKNVSVGDAIGANRIFERGHHMALADDVLQKFADAIFAR